MKEFELKGNWFLPSHRDHSVSGILKFDPVEGAMLEIIGEFPDRRPFEFLTPQREAIDIIWGFTEKGDAVTLYKCSGYNAKYSIGYVGTAYQVSAIFQGCFFENDADLYFDSVSINYSDLEYWIGITGFSGDKTFDDVKGFGYKEAKVTSVRDKKLILMGHYKSHRFTNFD